MNSFCSNLSRGDLSLPRAGTALCLALVLTFLGTEGLNAKPVKGSAPPSMMSAMGQLAQRVAHALAGMPNGGVGTNFHALVERNPVQPGQDGLDSGPAGGQAELAIAVDATGQHIVVGYNDTRGFYVSPRSVSGYAYSDDGGATFVDGGQLPAQGNPPLNGSIGSTLYPQVYGDPDVKYVPGGNGLQFVYSSILFAGTGAAPNFSGTAQTMCIHRSTDGGHTWQGPFEVTAATGNGDADKEFMDIEPGTGRVLMSWTSFGSSEDICTTFSDDVMSGNPPTWSPRVVLNGGTLTSDQGSVPRFGPAGSGKVYVAWAEDSSSLHTAYGQIAYGNIAVAASIDHGATWGPPIQLTADFFPIDYILGNDRVHSFPGLAVDQSPGTNQGNIYVVYAQNNSRDGSDIAFQRSTDGANTFSAPVLLNSRPGNDRSQWFPFVTVDRNTGRVSVVFYDQGIADSGDLMETTWVYSDDGGLTWSQPRPITRRPFHGGYGNDTGQPNLGDYIGAVAQNGTVYAAWAGTPPFVSFVDGQPNSQFTVPDFYLGIGSNSAAPLNLGQVSFTEDGGNGFLDPGDTVSLSLPLRHFVTNPLFNPQACTGVTETLSSTNTGVLVLSGTQTYPEIAPGQTATNTVPFTVQLQPGFPVGATIEFSLTVTSSQGSATLLFSQTTGTPSSTVLWSEDFSGVSPGALPSGWTASHVGGNNTVPWTTRNNVPGAPGGNALFHINANDGSGGDNTRWERASSPSIAIPTNAAYVTLDFDLWYDTEDDPDFNILAYDGATLRILDQTAGHNSRANLVEAFASQIRTGSRYHFPKHLPRSDSSAYFQDMSVWGGASAGWQHAHLELPGMAGTTVLLRWEYTQDANAIATDVRPASTYCGVAVDNIVLSSVALVQPAPLLVAANPVPGGLVLNWPALSGHTYEVQFKSDLAQANWSHLVQVVATNNTGFASDLFTNAVRFYRVVAQ